MFKFKTVIKATLQSTMAGAALFCLSAAAQADETAAPDGMNDRAFDVAMARIGQDLSHEQVAVLNLLAHATAAAGMCEDLKLDEGAVHGALVEATHDATMNMSDDDMEFHRDFAMMAYGVLVGFALDRAAKDEAAFCSSAMQSVDDPEENMFLAKVDDAPPESEGDGTQQ